MGKLMHMTRKYILLVEKSKALVCLATASPRQQFSIVWCYMQLSDLHLVEDLVGKSYISQASQGIQQRERLFKNLLAQRTMPEEPWDDESIELFLHQLSSMDSNNFPENIGIGEREGRIFSSLVRQRHFGMSHGIGRSGDLVEVQPKAAGSSLMYKLATALVVDALRLAGLSQLKCALIIPSATGMSIAVALLALKSQKPSARYVLWPRIDQKSCFKAMLTAGLTPIVIENVLEGHQLRTNLSELENELKQKSPNEILCVLSTTSCFAPRAVDRVEEIAALCKRYDVAHVINNAYGIQSSKITHLVNQACLNGRVDVVVQSTDKNLMVPVGGAIIASPSKVIVDLISKSYPGRASATPVMDILITLLAMGRRGFLHLLHERKELFDYMKQKLKAVAEQNGERLLETSQNPISMGISLCNPKFFPSTLIPQVSSTSSTASPTASGQLAGNGITLLGSMLFARCCSGARIVDVSPVKKQVSGFAFQAFGSHSDHYPTNYLTVSCAIGAKKSEIDIFIERLGKSFVDLAKKQKKQSEATHPDSQKFV